MSSLRWLHSQHGVLEQEHIRKDTINTKYQKSHEGIGASIYSVSSIVTP